MFIDIEKPQVMHFTKKSDSSFPKQYLFMPFNMQGELSAEELEEASKFWENNVLKCEIISVFEEYEEEPKEIEFAVGYLEENPNPVIEIQYPEEPKDETFVGWRIKVSYEHGWTSEDDDESHGRLRTR